MTSRFANLLHSSKPNPPRLCNLWCLTAPQTYSYLPQSIACGKVGTFKCNPHFFQMDLHPESVQPRSKVYKPQKQQFWGYAWHPIFFITSVTIRYLTCTFVRKLRLWLYIQCGLNLYLSKTSTSKNFQPTSKTSLSCSITLMLWLSFGVSY